MKSLGFTYDSIGRGPAEAVHNELAATLACHTDQMTSVRTESASRLEAPPTTNFNSTLLEDRYDAPSTARLA